MTGAVWASCVPVLEKMLPDLKALNAYFRGEIEHSEYCKRVGIAARCVVARDPGKCADCGCDLLAGARSNPMPGFVAAIQFVRRTTGKNVFICWRCAGERYKARQVNAY